MDRSTKKVRTITGPAEDTPVIGEALCGGAVGRAVRMRWDASSQSISQMMCWMMTYLKILSKKKKESSCDKLRRSV